MSIPPYKYLLNLTLTAIKELGGIAHIRAIESKVAEILNLSESEISEIHAGKRTKLDYNLAWARYYLRKYDLIDRVDFALWNLTTKGKSVDSVDEALVIESVNSLRQTTQEIDDEILDDSEDVIVIDDDESNESGLYPYDPSKADIDIRESPHSVYELMRKYDQEKLIIDPDFQRNLVWKPEQKSEFIESLILNFPIPSFYVNQTIDGKFIIVDGLQRTTTMHSFINNEFSLVGLKALPDLNGKTFEELSGLGTDFQTRIEDKKLNLHVIQPSVPIKIVYDIFKRINTNGTPLERQEVRNCIFIGKSTKLLKELSEQPYFKKAIDNGVSSRRMKDREIILRYLSFKIFDYKIDYKGDMSEFVENAMRKINLYSSHTIELLKIDFERVMKLTYNFFGYSNFRRATKDTRGTINTAIFESVSYFFSIKSDIFLLENKDMIIDNYSKLLSDGDYFDAVSFSTGSRSRVITRFNKALEILGNV